MMTTTTDDEILTDPEDIKEALESLEYGDSFGAHTGDIDGYWSANHWEIGYNDTPEKSNGSKILGASRYDNPDADEWLNLGMDFRQTDDGIFVHCSGEDRENWKPVISVCLNPSTDYFETPEYELTLICEECGEASEKCLYDDDDDEGMLTVCCQSDSWKTGLRRATE